MREDWAGKVKLYAISLLNDNEQIKKIVSDNGWDKYQFFAKGKSLFRFLYKVYALPHCLLIDTEGKIVF